jgi:signal transduction histidine kinase
MLDDLGILPALFWYFERYTEQTNVQVVCQHTGLDRRFPPDIEITIYRIVQEALSNIARHAGVSEAVVHMYAYPDQIAIQVEDQGVGFEPEAVRKNANAPGLAAMRERTHLLGGQMSIDSSPEYGTCLTVELPLSPESDGKPAD